MANLATAVAAAAGCAAQPERGAIGLDMAEALAVVALLGLGGTRQRTLVGLVAY